MATLSNKDLSSRMSQRLSNFKLSDAVVKDLADRVVIDGLSIGKFYPCMYGICVDYFTDKWPKLDDLAKRRGISKWEVFPYGIIDWDRFRVRVAYEVDGIQANIHEGIR